MDLNVIIEFLLILKAAPAINSEIIKSMYNMIKPPLISVFGEAVEDRGEINAWDVEYRAGSKVRRQILE